jgi:hypothetical protein
MTGDAREVLVPVVVLLISLNGSRIPTAANWPLARVGTPLVLSFPIPVQVPDLRRADVYEQVRQRPGEQFVQRLAYLIEGEL